MPLLAILLAGAFVLSSFQDITSKQVFRLDITKFKGNVRTIELSPMCFWMTKGHNCVGLLVSNGTSDSSKLVFVDGSGTIVAETNFVPFGFSKDTDAAVFRSSHDKLYLCLNSDSCYLLEDSRLIRSEDPWSAPALYRKYPGVCLNYAYDINKRKRPLFFTTDSLLFVLRTDSTLVVHDHANGASTVGRIEYPDFNYLISQRSDPFVYGSLDGVVLFEDPFDLHFYKTGHVNAHHVLNLWEAIRSDLHGKETNIRAEAELMGISLFLRGSALYAVVFAKDSILVYQIELKAPRVE